MSTTEAVRARPILMSGPMVRAILEGRKTVTRRIVTPQSMFDGKDAIVRQFPNQHGSPFGAPGDLLWVREAWQAYRGGHCDGEWDIVQGVPLPGLDCIEYRATSDSEGPWRSPRSMPRWASRLTLEVVSVRVERVQEITEEDALREGVTIRPDAEIAARIAGDTPARMEFWHLWESIHGPGAWERNDWVWRVEFRRLEADHAD